MHIELDTPLAAKIVKSVGLAVSKDKSRIALTGISWVSENGRHTFAATDGYRLHMVQVETGTGPSVRQEVVLSGDALKAVQTCAKATGKDGKVTLSVDSAEYTCEVSGLLLYGALARVRVQILVSEFPDVPQLLQQVSGEFSTAIFDGGFLSDMGKAADIWGGPLVVESLDARRPARFTAENGAGVFTGILMPQRAGK